MSAHPPLPALTRQLNEIADAGATPGVLADELRGRAPGMSTQIERDGRNPDLLGAWGTSSPSDASQPDRPTVHPGVLRAIGLLAGVEMGGGSVHAGLMHTYGYLLSNLKTPFGFKRQRYTQAAIARGLDLRPLGLLSPWPGAGTLLGNLSAVSGVIAVPGFDRGICGTLPAALRAFDARRFARYRVTETVMSLDGGTPPEDLVLQTDFVEFARAEADAFSHLLVYSILMGGRQLLITAFPVKEWVVAKLRKRCAKRSGDADAPVKLRYNARLPQLRGARLGGRCEFAALG